MEVLIHWEHFIDYDLSDLTNADHSSLQSPILHSAILSRINTILNPLI